MDKSWVDDLIKETHSNVTVKRVTRLGKTSTDRKRPILICLSSEDEKFNLLGNLPALKGNEKFSGVSITEDLTPDLRKKVHQLSIEAKELNATKSPTSGIYRVRGNSKNGFSIKMVPLKKKSSMKKSPTEKNVSFSENLTETNIIKE